jgi:hypothetical protein
VRMETGTVDTENPSENIVADGASEGEGWATMHRLSQNETRKQSHFEMRWK